MQCAHQHDAEHGLEGAERQLFRTREEVAGGVVHEDIERAVLPDGFDHFFHLGGVADIAGTRVDGTAGSVSQFGLGRGEDFVTPSADVDGGAELEKSLSSGFAKSSAAAGDEDAFVLEKIFLEHECTVRGLDCIHFLAGTSCCRRKADYPACAALGFGIRMLKVGLISRLPAQEECRARRRRRRGIRNPHTGNVVEYWSARRSA